MPYLPTLPKYINVKGLSHTAGDQIRPDYFTQVLTGAGDQIYHDLLSHIFSSLL